MGTRAGTGRRFIPACAGNSSGDIVTALFFAVHPRVCGEQPEDEVARDCAAGSSPRVRGTGILDVYQQEAQRFIPACAGNRAARRERAEARSVHPRVCGEQSRQQICQSQAFGSSPRVRGTAPKLKVENYRERFIPACAGNR